MRKKQDAWLAGWLLYSPDILHMYSFKASKTAPQMTARFIGFISPFPPPTLCRIP